MSSAMQKRGLTLGLALAFCQLCTAQFDSPSDVTEAVQPGTANSTVALWSSVERELFKHLADKFNPDVRPVRNVRDALSVELYISHQGIHALDQDAGTMTNSVIYRMKWRSPFLSWDTSKYDIPWIRLSPDSIWVPDIAVRNVVSVQESPLMHTTYMIVTNDGSVIMEKAMEVETLCEFKMADFPFDTQVCPVYFGLESSSESEVELLVDTWDSFEPLMPMPNYTSISWLLMNATIDTESVSYSTATGFVETQTYYVMHVTAMRAPQFYMANGVLPTIIITFVSMLTFFLPGTMIERMGFGATCLLSVVAVMFVVADKLPTQGVQTLMDQFFFISLLINVIAMVISSYVVIMSLNASLASLSDVAGPISDPKFLDKITRVVFPIVYVAFCADMLNQAPAEAINKMRGVV